MAHWISDMENELLANGKLNKGNSYELRRNGKSFSLKEHIRAMVYSMLSAMKDWGQVQPRLPIADKIFHDYDSAYLKSASPEMLNKELKDVKLGSLTRAKQMAALKGNVEIFERIEAGYPGGLDRFVIDTDKYDLVSEFSGDKMVGVNHKATKKPGKTQFGNIKLGSMGVALVCEYLKNVGIDIVKPDIHLRRFVKRFNGCSALRYRMDWADGKTEKEHIAGFMDVFEVTENIHNVTGLPLSEIDAIIWSYCAEQQGNVCAASGKCGNSVCVLSGSCKKDFY